jgi:hypothetical protein
VNDEARPNLEPIEKMVDALGVGAVFGEPIREDWERNTVQHSASRSKETPLNMRGSQARAHPCNA